MSAPLRSTPNYPIETETQVKFWGSRNKENRAKALIAFSVDRGNAFQNMRRKTDWLYGYRKRMWDKYGQYVNTPSLSGVPFTE